MCTPRTTGFSCITLFVSLENPREEIKSLQVKLTTESELIWRLRKKRIVTFKLLQVSKIKSLSLGIIA